MVAGGRYCTFGMTVREPEDNLVIVEQAGTAETV